MPKFRLGQVVATPGVIGCCTPEYMAVILARHSNGDWGDVDETDKAMNDDALRYGDRVLSAYPLKPGSEHIKDKVWIITEADRSVTTLLLPNEY